MRIDPKALASGLADTVKDYFAPIAKGIEDRFEALTKRLDDLPTPIPGKDGEKGLKGDAGEKGDPGESIKGDPGPKGEDGERGSDGRDGRDGTDGRDAMEIEIVRGINPEKAYPRGAFAAHEGSLWMARKNTDGMEGWECIVAGMGEPRIDYDGERSFTITIPYGETVVTRKAILPVVLDAGFYQQGKTYQPGDGVTFGGSYWIAKCDTGTKPGTGNEDWRLAVKKGRDAKGGA